MNSVSFRAKNFSVMQKFPPVKGKSSYSYSMIHKKKYEISLAVSDIARSIQESIRLQRTLRIH